MGDDFMMITAWLNPGLSREGAEQTEFVGDVAMLSVGALYTALSQNSHHRLEAFARRRRARAYYN